MQIRPRIWPYDVRLRLDISGYLRSKHGFWLADCVFGYRNTNEKAGMVDQATMNYKQLLDEVFVISRKIKVEVGVISRSWRLRLITLTETLIILDVTKTESNNCFITNWREKNGSHVFASPLTTSNTKRANLTWLPLEIMHRGHTWHDYSWPWVSLTWLLYNLQLDDVTGTDFENSLYAFGPSEKR